MKILMLGWEYPPHISGGLGTACEGLTKGLARQNISIAFVVPHLYGGENARHMSLVDAIRGELVPSGESGELVSFQIEQSSTEGVSRRVKKELRFSNIITFKVPAFLSPYWRPEDYQGAVEKIQAQAALSSTIRASRVVTTEGGAALEIEEPEFRQYGHDIFHEVERFAAHAAAIAGGASFDIIHAHDWMTFPAGVALSYVTGKPLVLHVHSLEHDRSGSHVNQQIYDVERFGLHACSHIIAVSYYTRALIHEHYGVPLEKISVVHNGIYTKKVVQSYRELKGWPSKVVLFLGRITFQKGPDYFVEAAARVIPHVPDVLFVMAGAGDMLSRMVSRVRELKIESHFYFPGFLKGPEVEHMFSLADVYVMPSVSEPFGIAALEAINFETPVIISRQSGVSEVLSHALKVDFWDIERLADLIINALLHEELRADMTSMAREEVKKLHWDAAALSTIDIYRKIT